MTDVLAEYQGCQTLVNNEHQRRVLAHEGIRNVAGTNLEEIGRESIDQKALLC